MAAGGGSWGWSWFRGGIWAASRCVAKLQLHMSPFSQMRRAAYSATMIIAAFESGQHHIYTHPATIWLVPSIKRLEINLVVFMFIFRQWLHGISCHLHTVRIYGNWYHRSSAWRSILIHLLQRTFRQRSYGMFIFRQWLHGISCSHTYCSYTWQLVSSVKCLKVVCIPSIKCLKINLVMFMFIFRQWLPPAILWYVHLPPMTSWY